MKRNLLIIVCILALLVGAFGVAAAAKQITAAAKIGETTYETLQDAVDAVKEGDQNGLIVLQQPVDSVTIDCDVEVDLNGKDIGSLTVNNGIFYGMDSQTDDFEIDAVNRTGYGKIGEIKGNAENVKGIPVGNENAAEGCSYLMVNEDGIGTSFHCVNLYLENMTLRPTEVGLYFKSNFGGDALVAENVTSFGVALSLKGEPTEQNLATDCQKSVFTGFQAGENTTNTSTILQGVMKQENPKLVNRANSQMPVYGRAYVQLSDGTYIFGNAQSRSLKEQVVELSKDEEKVTDDVVTMYENYKFIMNTWTDIDGVKEKFMEKEDGILRILNISNSHGQDAVWQIPTVLNAERPDVKYMIAECYFSGALKEHVANAKNYAPEYVYWTKTNTDELWNETRDVTIAYALEQEHWDIVMFNESSRHLGLEKYMSTGRIDWFRSYILGNLDYEPTLYYNMTWSNPTDLRFHDPNLSDRRKALAGHKDTYTKDYGFDHVNHYNCLVSMTEKYLVDHEGFDKIIWDATPIQYAQTEYGVGQWDDDQKKDLYRDYTHLSDFGRLIVAYQFYAQLFDLKEITDVNVDVIPQALRATDWQIKLGDLEITDWHKDIIVGCVNHTLEHPLTVED